MRQKWRKCVRIFGNRRDIEIPSHTLHRSHSKYFGAWFRNIPRKGTCWPGGEIHNYQNNYLDAKVYKNVMSYSVVRLIKMFLQKSKTSGWKGMQKNSKTDNYPYQWLLIAQKECCIADVEVWTDLRNTHGSSHMSCYWTDQLPLQRSGNWHSHVVLHPKYQGKNLNEEKTSHARTWHQNFRDWYRSRWSFRLSLRRFTN